MAPVRVDPIHHHHQSHTSGVPGHITHTPHPGQDHHAHDVSGNVYKHGHNHPTVPGMTKAKAFNIARRKRLEEEAKRLADLGLSEADVLARIGGAAAAAAAATAAAAAAAAAEIEELTPEQAAERKAAKRLAVLKRRHRWQQKKCMLLSAFLAGLIFASIFLFIWYVKFIHFNIPPTPHGSDSMWSTLICIICLIGVCPIGFILLSLRVSHMLGGIIFMFFSVVTISFGVKGVARSFYSLSIDELTQNMRYEMKKSHDDTEQIQPFYNLLQTTCECCGFSNIDRVQDWPRMTKTFDFPVGCCTKDEDNNEEGFKVGKNISDCGRDLGWMHEKRRTPGGFQLFQWDSEMELWINRSSNSIPGKLQARKEYRLNTFSQNFTKEFTQDLIKDLVKTMIEQLKVELKEANLGHLGFYDDTKKELKTPVVPTELLIKIDLFVEEIFYKYKDSEPPVLNRAEWFYFKMPVDREHKVFKNAVRKVPPTPSPSTIPTSIPTSPTTETPTTTTTKKTTTTLPTVPVVSTTARPGQLDCSRNVPIKAKDDNDCEGYYECEVGFAFEKHKFCPLKHHFDEVKQECVETFGGPCLSRPTLTSTVATITPTSLRVAADDVHHDSVITVNKVGIAKSSRTVAKREKGIRFEDAVDDPLNLYYVTRGVPENIILDKIFWKNRCDRDVQRDKNIGIGLKCKELVSSNFIPLNNWKDYVKWNTNRKKFEDTFSTGRKKNSFFERSLFSLMRTNIGFDMSVIAIQLILALIFWYFFARLKAEELTALTLPPDFDLLEVNLPGVDDLDDNGHQLEAKLLGIKIDEFENKRHSSTNRPSTSKKGRVQNSTSRPSRSQPQHRSK